MSWVQITIVAAIVSGASAIGLSEYLIRRRRTQHAMLAKRYENLPKRPDTWDDEIDWGGDD